MSVNKLERNGQVAVLYSPGFGAGWSTRNDDEAREFLVFDAELVQCVIDMDIGKAIALAQSKFPDGYFGGGKDLTVKWIDKGKAFEVTEYDGSEDINIVSNNDYLVA